MSHTLAKIARFIGNYLHYRRNGFGLKEAWHLANMTLL